MKKILCLVVLLGLLVTGNSFAADVWEEGAGADVISGGDSPSDIDSLLDAASTEPLGRLLQEYRQGARIEYASASTITVTAGQVAVQNAGGTIVAFLDNTSATTVTWSDIDTGAEAASTTYYLYAFCTTPASDTDFDVCISTNASAPTGKTYYARLGSFYNNSSSNIDQNNTIVNDNFDITTAQVISTDLKTTMSAVSTSTVSGTMLTLPGGEYGFYPQTKMNDTDASDGWMATMIGHSNVKTVTGYTSYTTKIYLKPNTGGTIYAQQRYVTASGLDDWLFISDDLDTPWIDTVWYGKDHPAYGNGGDFTRIPHPFNNTKKEKIILVDKATTLALIKEAEEKEIDLLTLINKDYKVDYTSIEKYIPLHSGKYLGKEPMLVYDIPAEIKVKKLVRLNDYDKIEIENEKEALRSAEKKKEKEKEDKIKSAEAKLKALGLTDEEIAAWK